MGLSPIPTTLSDPLPASFQVSKYTASLASSVASPSDKVAAFVLSSADFMSQCSMRENESSSTDIQGDVENKSVVNDSESHSDQTASDSSANTFETCSESPCVQNLVNEKEKELSLNHHTHKGTNADGRILKIKTPESKWKPPTQPVATDICDIVTSDDSFLSHRSPRIYRMKSRQIKLDKNTDLLSAEKKSKTPRDMMPPPNVKVTMPSANPSLKLSGVFVPSDDSLLSTITSKEVIVKDEMSGIVLIERHTPSVCGSSVGRRSLDSITSGATIDSQATLIYDWHTLGQISKQTQSKFNEGSKKNKPLTHVKSETVNTGLKILSSQSSSGFSSDSNTLSFQTQDDLPDSKVPDYLSTLSCEEISQKLQKYGELPGPVVASTKQVYLKRLASLEANPGLVTLSSKVPDYPPELRQALEGKFDASHLPMLEAKMVEEFSAASSVNKQWREGTSKSSFTYLLLDPRVTENLPLRAKDMTPVLMNHTKARHIESTPDPSPYKDPREPQETIARPKSPYKNSREP
ncbi:ankyrin repeat and LEM domain-containing protein 1 [Elysia marginata]|uniref:Ankyrin repeat and LEM domain-containing protein 1 n=1 Tax=Elysia marginata TaxID=1093978 RepID=A0AAV4EVP2_9GAST|nr:ankyrin repeat and LEM domain-containing protein 1 [Elysia marginata]